MAGRSTARHVDAEPGWAQRRFREVEQKIAGLQVGKLSTVPGSSVTIQQILTDPASVIGFVDTDQVTASTDDATVLLSLTYVPIDGSLHVRQNGVDLHASEWSRDAQVVTIEPATDLHIHAGDFFDAAYAYDAVLSSTTPGPLSSLTVRGGVGPTASPTTMDLPADTEVGDLIVVAFAAMHFDGTPGTSSVADARLTQVGHGAWVGIASDLTAVGFTNPDGSDDRFTASIATFGPPAIYKNDADAGPSTGGSGTLTAPVVSASGAVLVVTGENPNGLANTIDSVPAGYTVVVDPSSAALVCQAGIWSWVDPTKTTSPTGSIGYTVHASGHAYATAIGLQEGI